MNRAKKVLNNILQEHSDLVFVVIFIFALALRFIKAYLKTSLTGDEAFFMNIGMNLLNGRLAADIHSDMFMWAKYVLHHPPVHTFFIAAVFKIAGIGYQALKTVPFIIGSITVIITYIFTKRYIGRKEALLLSVFLCFDPIYFARSIDGRPEMTMILFFTVSVLFYILALRENKLLFFALSGIFAGITFLTNYNGYWLVLSALIYMFFSKRFLKQIRAVFSYLSAFLITIFPYLIWLFWDVERKNIFFYQIAMHTTSHNIKYAGLALFMRKLLNPLADLYIMTFREWSIYPFVLAVVIFVLLFLTRGHKYLLCLLLVSFIMTIPNFRSERYPLITMPVCYISLGYVLKEMQKLNVIRMRKIIVIFIFISLIIAIPVDVSFALSRPALKLDIDYYRDVFEKETPPGSRIVTDPALILSASEGREILNIGDLIWSWYRRFYSYREIVNRLKPDYIILTEQKKRWAEADDPQGEAFWGLIRSDFVLKKIIEDKVYGKLWIYAKR